MNTLLIIDGNALLHRAYHALPDFKAKDGIPTNAIYGFASIIHKVRSQVNPTHIIVCFDTQAPTFRDKMFENYRAHRPKTDDDLIRQFPIARDFLKAAGIVYLEKDGVEADDLIAAIAHRTHNKDFRTIILTGDKDIFQLINDSVFVLTPQLGYVKNGILYDRDKVIKKFGIPPEKIADYKALVGDPSDNYKGVAGIGPKSAVKLINKFESIENMYKNIDSITNETLKNKLIKDKDNAILSKKLAVLAHNTKIAFRLADSKFNDYNEVLKDFFDDYEFRSLKKRFFADDLSKPIKRKEKTKPKKDQLGLF